MHSGAKAFESVNGDKIQALASMIVMEIDDIPYL